MGRKWSKAELARLRKLVRKHGNKWTIIAQHMEGRSRSSCEMKAYKVESIRKLLPASTCTPWTISEVTKLRKLVRKYGNQWTIIAQQMGERTRVMCCSKVANMRLAKKWDVTPSTSRTAQDQHSQKQKKTKRSAAKRKRSASAEQSRKVKAPRLEEESQSISKSNEHPQPLETVSLSSAPMASDISEDAKALLMLRTGKYSY